VYSESRTFLVRRIEDATVARAFNFVADLRYVDAIWAFCIVSGTIEPILACTEHPHTCCGKLFVTTVGIVTFDILVLQVNASFGFGFSFSLGTHGLSSASQPCARPSVLVLAVRAFSLLANHKETQKRVQTHDVDEFLLVDK
jgi:hypothetical protein